jgi:hypothetical protein
MNFRITTFFFGLLLTMLWVFGLMIAHKKTAGDPTAIVPTLADAKIDSITVQRSEKGKDLPPVVFAQKDDTWYLKEGGQETKVEGFQINRIIDQIRDARPDEDADVTGEPSTYGMNAPELVVALKGKAKGEATEWKLFVGKISPDNMAYVNSSDRQTKVFAVAKKNIESLFFEDPNYLRSKRLFDFMENAVTEVIAKQGDKELDLKRNDQTSWIFVKPPLGYAGPDNPEPPVDDKKKPFFPPKEKEKEAEGIRGVKALLDAVKQVRVDEDRDLVPLGKSPAAYGLEPGKETMRIDVRYTNEKKDSVTETLLVGKEAPAHKLGRFYFARMASDDGVFELSAKYLDPLTSAVADPGKIRSLDIGAFDPKAVDAVVIKQGKDEVKFLRPEKKFESKQDFPRLARPDEAWQMYAGSEKKTANGVAVEKLIEQVLGKGAIVKFIDETDAAAQKKFDAESGLDAPSAEIAVYTAAVEIEKKEEKKDEKDKIDKKDEKDKLDKKDEKTEATLTLKKDAKAAITLAIGKADKEYIYVRRTLQDGTTVSRFTVKKEFLEKVLPPEGVTLAYADTTLPGYSAESAFAITLTRTTDKGPERLELLRRSIDDKLVWYVKDPLEKSGYKLANEQVAPFIANVLAQLPVKKWVKKLDDKEDLDKFGLKNPVVIVTVSFKKTPLSTNAIVNLMGTVSTEPMLLAALAGLAAHQQADKGEDVTFEFGKDTDDDKDKPGTFGKQSKSKLLFLVEPHLVKTLKEQDLIDRTRMLYAQGEIEALYKGSAASGPMSLMMLASPYFTGQVHQFDPDKVKEVRLSVRTPYELRSFTFERNAKDKTWTDKSNLLEFKLDGDKVTQLVKDVATLKTDRFVAFAGGPRGEHKLGAKDATVKLDLTTDDGKAITLLVGARYQNRGYFANTSLWPETVFFVPGTLIEPLLHGIDHFAKERVVVQ